MMLLSSCIPQFLIKDALIAVKGPVPSGDASSA
jgi:hypothetical protein